MTTTTTYLFIGHVLLGGRRPVPPDGVWLDRAGLYASRRPWSALQHATGETLCLAEVEDVEAENTELLVARRLRIVRRVDLTADLWLYARACALDVLHVWDAPDVVRRYLATGDETLRAEANAAARDAAWNAAVNGRDDETWAAAWSAAHAAATPTTNRPVIAWMAKEDTAEGAARGAASAAAWAVAAVATKDTGSTPTAWGAALADAEAVYGARFDALCRQRLAEIA